jgi:SAM-dependent methyltransferase
VTQPIIESRACPVCQATSFEVLFRQRFVPVTGARLLDGYEVRVCGVCGCGYAGGIPPQRCFDEYYRDSSKYEHQDRSGRESSSDRETYRMIVDRLVPHIPGLRSRIMDVGCATGGLLDELQKRGFTSLLGVDPSAACAAFAETLYGLRVCVGTLSELPKEASGVDVAVLVGVLEHVRDVRDAVSRVRPLLAADGMMCVVVPDATAFIDCLTAPFQHFSTEHINFFAPQSLTNLMRVSGFEEVHVSRFLRDHCTKNAEPLLAGIFRVSREKAGVVDIDQDTGVAIRDYVRGSAEMEQRMIESLKPLKMSHVPVLVWGVGTQTQRMLAVGAFDGINVKAYVDSNPKYQGKELAGVPVLSPEEVRHRTETILVCSCLYHREIENQIRKDLGLANEVLAIAG